MWLIFCSFLLSFSWAKISRFQFLRLIILAVIELCVCVCVCVCVMKTSPYFCGLKRGATEGLCGRIFFLLFVPHLLTAS